MKKLNKKGFSHVEIIFSLLVIAVIGVVGFYVAYHRSTVKASAASQASEVYGWGSYVGGTSNVTNLKPLAIGNLSSIVSINAGNSSDYALQCIGGKTDCPTDGVIWSWGNNNNGQLGDGNTTISPRTPVQVQFPAGTHIVSIGEADNDGYAVDSNGQGWAWGANGEGSLCIGNTTQQDTPVKVTGVQTAVAVQGGQGHVIWQLANGTLVACGHNNFGQVGDGTTRNTYTPVAVKGLTNIVQISAGNRQSAAVDKNGNLYMWGDNLFGQVGVCSTASYVATPTLVKLPLPVKEVSAGGSGATNGQTIALLSDNSVYAWGDNTWGQLGNGNKTNETCPVPITPPTGVTYSQVIAGGSTSYGLDTSGNVWAWGYGAGGRLGDDVARGATYTSGPIKIDAGVDNISSTASNAIDHH